MAVQARTGQRCRFPIEKKVGKLKKVLSGVVETIAREYGTVNDENAKKWRFDRKYDMSILENLYIPGRIDWLSAHLLGGMG
jgi:hypothetical protein